MTEQQEQQHLKCGTCRVVFDAFEVQREHYKSDWHKFNLKRKVASLPPATEDEFKAKQASLKEKEQKKPEASHCRTCNKSFGTQNSYQQHLRSKAHLKIEAKKKERREKSEGESDKESLTESLKESEEKKNEMNFEPLTIRHCLFCSKRLRNRTTNLAHMAKEHGLFLPDVEYLSDLTGLLEYLAEKVTKYHQCFYCKPAKQFASAFAVQDHMRSVNHCKIRYETDEDLAEFDDFYNFSSSYETYTKRMKLNVDKNDEVEGEEEEKEEKEEKEEVEEREEGEGDERAVVLLEESVKGNVKVTDAGHELIFSNGKAIGHRDYAVYYKQKIRPVDTRECTRIAKMMAEYKALGYVAPRNERQFTEKKILRMQAKERMQVGVKGNKLFKVRLQVREC